MSTQPESTACDLYDADRPLNMRCACGRSHGRSVAAEDKLEASLLKALTGYGPSTGIATGVAEIVTWFRAYHRL